MRESHSCCLGRLPVFCVCVCVCSLTVTQGCDRTSSAVKRLSTFTCSIWLISSCRGGGGVELEEEELSLPPLHTLNVTTPGLRLEFVPLLAEWRRPSPGTGTPASLWGSGQTAPPAHCSHWGHKEEQSSGTTADCSKATLASQLAS